MHLTPKQKKVFEYIRAFISTYDMPPTYDEIRKKFQYNSFNSVFKHIKQLELKGVITIQPNKARAIMLMENGSPSFHLKILGTVAAGVPIEAIEESDSISVPQEMIGRGENFCLKVEGDSMIGDGILDGDMVVVNKRSSASNNEMVVAMIDNEVTLKRFFKNKRGIVLKPSNPALQPITVPPSSDFRILGVVSGLLRSY